MKKKNWCELQTANMVGSYQSHRGLHSCVLSCFALFTLGIVVNVVDGQQGGGLPTNGSTGTSGNQDKPVDGDRGVPYHIVPAGGTKDLNDSVHHLGRSGLGCTLFPSDEAIPEKIQNLRGKGIKLITYDIKFPTYRSNDPLGNMAKHFHPGKWQRAFDKHGRTLLSLAFNYEILSLMMLTFGVEKFKIPVVDRPAKCFGNLSESEKIHALMDLVITDFRSKNPRAMDEDDYVCHQVIHGQNGYAHFNYRCCHRPTGSKTLHCIDDIPDTWYQILNYLIMSLKLLFLFFGPLAIHQWIYNESIRKTDYIIKLKNPITKTLLKNSYNKEDNSNNEKEEMDMRKFRTMAQNPQIPENKPIKIEFKKLHVFVDHKLLIPEDQVPVGILQALYRNILRCQLRFIEPFHTCCDQSIFGSWESPFLCFKWTSTCGDKFRGYFIWKYFFKAIGAVLTLLLIPLPYYIRLLAYYYFEDDMVEHQKKKAESLGLQVELKYNLVQHLTPTHGGLLAVYILYVLSFVLVGTLRIAFRDFFDRLVRDVWQDLRELSYLAVLKSALAHLLLPIEKFGLCGFLIGLLYWPIAIVICLILAVAYCVPLVYLCFRFIIHKRPVFLNSKSTGKPKETISYGTSSVESTLLLANISPRDKKHPRRLEIFIYRVLGVFIGLCCVGLMCSLMLMAAECFGFFVEVCVFTLMGAIVNASSAAKYLMLGFWIIMYASMCYNNVYNKYLELNKKLFEFIKKKLEADVKGVTRLRETKQRNTAFKFFTRAELQDEDSLTYDVDDDDEDSDDEDGRNSEDPCEKIENKSKKLYWDVISLILFVDKKDKPRIPKALFKAICEIQAPGCPGPVYKSLLRATQQLMYMLVFLAFVFIVISAFGNIYRISSTNQMLMTLVGGFVPTVIRFVIKPKQESLSLSTYSFEGKIYQIIRYFQQSWPVYDIPFKLATETSIPGYDDGPDVQNVPAVPDHSAIDIMIKVRSKLGEASNNPITDPARLIQESPNSHGEPVEIDLTGPRVTISHSQR